MRYIPNLSPSPTSSLENPGSYGNYKQTPQAFTFALKKKTEQGFLIVVRMWAPYPREPTLPTFAHWLLRGLSHLLSEPSHPGSLYPNVGHFSNTPHPPEDLNGSSVHYAKQDCAGKGRLIDTQILAKGRHSRARVVCSEDGRSSSSFSQGFLYTKLISSWLNLGPGMESKTPNGRSGHLRHTKW